MTVAELRRFRQLRRAYLRHGIGVFDDSDRALYAALMSAFDAWINHDVEESHREVVRYYFSRAYPDWAVSMRTYYSERQVRRIRAKIYASLQSVENTSNFALNA